MAVIPFFNKLKAEGPEFVPITDPEMTRFWITLDQGVNFVLSSINMMRGGEIFVPKIPSMKITELAKVILPGIPHKIVGIRPGEKLHEVMVPADDWRSTIELEDRFVIKPSFKFWETENDDHYEQYDGMEDGFSYSSDNNKEWLDKDSLLPLLESLN